MSTSSHPRSISQIQEMGDLPLSVWRLLEGQALVPHLTQAWTVFQSLCKLCSLAETDADLWKQGPVTMHGNTPH